MEKEDLRKLIEYHDNLYYNEGQPEISDAEYDALRDQLDNLKAGDFVSGAPTGLFAKFKHTHPITSLAKVNTAEDLEKELKRLLPVVIMPKFDGLTVVKYPHGPSVTRGNGEVGDDISANFDSIIQGSWAEPLRGEAIISKEDFILLNEERTANGEEPFKNARNAAAGILRSKENKYMKYISYVVYEAVGNPTELSKSFDVLSQSNLNVTDHWRYDSLESAYDAILYFDRDAYPYELDGLVIRNDDYDSVNKFGRTSHHPKNAVAYKFPAQGEWTKLTRVHWTVGRTGKVVPNAIFEPVEILDTTVQNATLHNIAYIDALRLSIGCDINVIKANDIIPAVVESKRYNPLNRVTAPVDCPVCGSILDKEKDQLYCYNISCDSKLSTHLAHLAGKDALDIRGLSDQTIAKLIEAGHVSRFPYLFALTKEQICEVDGFSDKSAANLFNAIQASRNVEFNRLLVAANMPNVGRTASKEIAKHIKDLRELSEDMANDFPIVGKIEGIGPTITSSIKKHFNTLLELSMCMDTILNPLYGAMNIESAYTICVTGKFDQPRTHYQKLIEDAGHQFASSITKKVTHLLAGEAAGSKKEKAEKAGIPILNSEEELIALLQR